MLRLLARGVFRDGRKPPLPAARCASPAFLPASASREFSSSGASSLSSSAAATRHVDVSSVRGRHIDSLFSFSADEITALLDMSAALKGALRRTGLVYQPLVGRSMAMLFQKRSTRTRVSTETGFAMLGGHALFLGEATGARRG